MRPVGVIRSRSPFATRDIPHKTASSPCFCYVCGLSTLTGNGRSELQLTATDEISLGSSAAMARDNDEVHKLWELPRHEFDQWRRENDLPKLLTFCKEVLPHFEEWQTTHRVSDDVFLAPHQPSRFFRGTRPLFLVSSTGPDYDVGHDATTAYFCDHPIDPRLDEERQRKDFGELRYGRNWDRTVTPYFHWLQSAKRIRSFHIPGDANALVKDFAYMQTEAYNTIFSRASLFHTHKVLKLGGVSIDAVHFDNRNLDFVDLDHLRVSGSGRSWQTFIAYASCRNLRFTRYGKPFVSFVKCTLEEPLFEHCDLERFEFIDSALSRPTFQDSTLSRCELRRSTMALASFQRCDLIDLKVCAPPRASAEHLSDFYKRLRVAFQAQGERQEASRFYYEERFQQLRGHAFPLIPRGAVGLPGLVYADTLKSLYEQWAGGNMSTQRVLYFLGMNTVRTAQTMVYPHRLLRFLRAKAILIPEFFDWAVWGFGERPARVFVWMAFVLGGFTLRYYSGQNEHLKGDILASLSCSTYNFATIGCEHRGPFDSVEGILGAMLLGIMVAGFANRTRY